MWIDKNPIPVPRREPVTQVQTQLGYHSEYAYKHMTDEKKCICLQKGLERPTSVEQGKDERDDGVLAARPKRKKLSQSVYLSMNGKCTNQVRRQAIG